MEKTNKRIYIQPLIYQIIIDLKISLQLESLMDPGEEPVTESRIEYLNNNIFKTNIG